MSSTFRLTFLCTSQGFFRLSNTEAPCRSGIHWVLSYGERGRRLYLERPHSICGLIQLCTRDGQALFLVVQRETEEKARQPETIARTQHKSGYATQSEAESKTPNPRTGRKTGINHLSRGPGKSAHRGPASGSRRDIRARPTQGRTVLAQGKAKLPGRPRDESSPREAWPASLHRRLGIHGALFIHTPFAHHMQWEM
jgi:hypothetical protein